MSGPGLIIFDVFKTLIDIEVDEEQPAAWDFVARWLSYHAVQISPRQLHRSYLAAVRRDFDASLYKHPDIDIGEILGAIISAHGAPDDLPALIGSTALLFRVVTTKSLTVYPETVSVLSRLHDSGRVRLAIASNTQRLFTTHELRRFGLDRFFECIVYSSDLKSGKPDPHIFRTVLDRMSAAPEYAIYVGDSLINDIYGAQQVGMRAVWIDRGDRPSGPLPPPVPDGRVPGAEFRRLPDVLFAMLEDEAVERPEKP